MQGASALTSTHRAWTGQLKAVMMGNVLGTESQVALRENLLEAFFQL